MPVQWTLPFLIQISQQRTGGTGLRFRMPPNLKTPFTAMLFPTLPIQLYNYQTQAQTSLSCSVTVCTESSKSQARKEFNYWFLNPLATQMISQCTDPETEMQKYLRKLWYAVIWSVTVRMSNIFCIVSCLTSKKEEIRWKYCKLTACQNRINAQKMVSMSTVLIL